jgi:TonB family protein
VCRRLRREAEQACDDSVLRLGVPAPDYAVHLVEVARSCRRVFPEPVAVPMARRSTLEGRIAAMLNPRLARTALSRRALTLTALGLLILAVPTAAFRVAQPGPLPLTGVVYDSSGGVLPGVSLTLEDERQNKWQSTSDASGKFEFGPVGPGSYTLEAAIAGFRSLQQTLALDATSDWSRAVTLQVGTVRESIVVREARPKPRASSESAAPAPVRVGGNIKPPTKTRDVRPVYPKSMREAGREGRVPLEAIIGRDGTVLSVRVATAQVHPDFAQAAIDAVQQWQFTPTLLNGKPVEVMMAVTIEFELED